jgi:hypothetical protein
MKNLITIIGLVIAIAITLFLTSCGSKYYLQRARINTYKAIAHGAKIDSLTKIVHDTAYIKSLSDDRPAHSIVVDTIKITKVIDSIKSGQIQQHKAVRRLQKLVCPDIGLDSIYTVWVSVGVNKYPLKIHVAASSRAGKVSYNLDVHNAEIPYTQKVVEVGVKPGNDGLKWWQVTLICTLIAVVALVVGFVFGWTKSKVKV